ncbi:YbfB/YjiJ family MFS transporter [Kitasatospora sp. NPDC002227]|uniref:YbfB/YjiJ family MFS transporter n=1 Tax=Kitasatospora sp. NPDC002227 TaxID=3154773 RepID=UPI003332385E
MAITEQVADAPAARRRALAQALGLATVPAIALGLGRFAYALLLPAMRAELHWSLATAGALSTANAVGYLLGALTAPLLTGRLGERTALLLGLGLTIASLAATAAGGAVPYLLAVRLAAGLGGAVALVAGGSLTARLGTGAPPGRATLLLSVYFAGGGLGILVSGLAVPLVLHGTHWRTAWLVLAALALLAAPACLPGASACRGRTPPVGSLRWPARELAALLGGYALYGAGYIAYMTFIVAYLRQGGVAQAGVTAFWVLLGAAAVVGALGWSPVLARLGGGRGAALLIGVTALGAALPLAGRGWPVTALSALLFGTAFLSVVTAVTASARDHLPSRHWTAAIAGLTTAFALGQSLGPVLAGALSDGPGGTAAGLGIGAALLALGALTALAQPGRAPRIPPPGTVG